MVHILTMALNPRKIGANYRIGNSDTMSRLKSDFSPLWFDKRGAYN